MARMVALSNVEHAALRVSDAPGPDEARLSRIPVFPDEFESIQREFPILFGTDEDGLAQAYALVGLDDEENLFVEEGRWAARYRPAVLARGPFSIGLHAREDGGHEPMVHIDLDDPRVGDAGAQPLFLSHGGNAPALEAASEALRRIHLGRELQATMFAAWDEAGLIEATRLEIQLDPTLRYDLVDLRTIGAEAFARLDRDRLAALHARGFLAAAVHVLSSLGNIAELVRRKNLRRRGAAR